MVALAVERLAFPAGVVVVGERGHLLASRHDDADDLPRRLALAQQPRGEGHDHKCRKQSGSHRHRHRHRQRKPAGPHRLWLVLDRECVATGQLPRQDRLGPHEATEGIAGRGVGEEPPLEVGLPLGREDAIHERGGQPQYLGAVRGGRGWLRVVVRRRSHQNRACRDRSDGRFNEFAFHAFP